MQFNEQIIIGHIFFQNIFGSVNLFYCYCQLSNPDLEMINHYTEARVVLHGTRRMHMDSIRRRVTIDNIIKNFILIFR